MLCCLGICGVGVFGFWEFGNIVWSYGEYGDMFFDYVKELSFCIKYIYMVYGGLRIMMWGILGCGGEFL